VRCVSPLAEVHIVRRQPDGIGVMWDAEDPFDDTKSTHLWIVNQRLVPVRIVTFKAISPDRAASEICRRNEAFASAKNPTEGEVGGVQRASRHDLVRALAPRYGHVSKHEKAEILDQVCGVTGYTRKYALTLLKDPPADEPPVKRKRRRSPSYGAAEVELLRLCWLVTDGICSKRLAPFLPELLDRLRRRQALQ
jgi:hypothetical protein